MCIQEGELIFDFPADWEVSQYDAWSFYRNRFKDSCTGCKAIDFVAILSRNRRELWLVEVKDYRRHPRTKAIDLPEEIALKVRDSLAGIVAASFQADDSNERSHANRALQNKKVRVAVHLEQPKKHSRLFPRSIDPSKVLQKLKVLIKPIDPHPLVVERSNCQFRAGWVVHTVGTGQGRSLDGSTE